MNLQELKERQAQRAARPKVQFPAKAQFLFQPAPYKIMHGGRGSSKSWDFVRALLAIGSTVKLFILCTREVQNSIDESVYKLIVDQITAMGLEGFYISYDTEIVGKNGTRIVFAGLKNQFRKIKSYEAVDICAVFEANNIADPVWETLEPTIRRDPPFGPFGQGSEIWIEFNPELATDATYKRYVLDPPPGAVVVEMNYDDNPWFPEILRRQMERMKEKDYDNYLTVWGGKTRKTLAGAVYAKELQAAITDDPPRISPHIRHDPKRGVIVVFDLGRADTCALWFLQQIGMDHAVIDYYGNTGFDFTHYIEEIRLKKYRIVKVILPHDARHKVISARFSVLQQARDEWGDERVPRPLPPTPASTRINALRSLFPRLYFAEGPTQAGVQGLTHYRFGVTDKGQRTADPLHDWASHPANSLEHYSLSLQPGIYEREEETEELFESQGSDTHYDQTVGWMR